MPAESIAIQYGSEESITDLLANVQVAIEYLGTIAFAVSGALVAGRKRMDISGVVVLGVIVAVGGGTLRDVILDRQVFWVADPAFFVVGVIAALLSIPVFHIASAKVRRGYWLVQSFDAFGMAMFVVVGTNIALDAGAHPIAAAALGVVSGIGGGMIRDVLAAEIPTVLTDGKLYLTAALTGAVVYIVLLRLDLSATYVVWVPIVIILSLRYVSLRYGIGVPTIGFALDDDPTVRHTGQRPPPTD
jgi:uncharacterized membrane protein YeiH